MADRRGRTEKDFCFVCSTREVHGLRKYSRGSGRGNEGRRTEPSAKLLSKLSDQLTWPWYFPSAGSEAGYAFSLEKMAGPNQRIL